MANATATKKVTVWDRTREWEKDSERRITVRNCGNDLAALASVCTLWANELQSLHTYGNYQGAAESLVCRLAGYTNTPCGWLTPNGRYVHPVYGDLTDGYGYEEDKYEEDEYDYEAELRYLNPWMAMEEDLGEYDY